MKEFGKLTKEEEKLFALRFEEEQKRRAEFEEELRRIKEEKEQKFEKERQEIMDIFKSMTKKELMNYIDENLFFCEDYCMDIWMINVNF